jgi:hypothetical protein
MLQQAICKPARGCAYVEARPAFGVDMPVLQRRYQLKAAAANVGHVVTQHAHGCVSGHRGPGFVYFLFVNQNTAGQNVRPRTLTAGSKSPLNQQ